MRALRIFLSDVVSLYRRHPIVAALTLLPWVCLVAVQPQGSRVELAIQSGVLTLFLQGLLSIYGLALEHRMATDADRTWMVEVGGVELGALSDAECAAMRHRAAFSPANYLRQLANVGQMAMNCLQWTTSAVPFLLFWLVVAGLLTDAAATVSTAREIWAFAQRSPEVFAGRVAEGLAITLTFGAFVAGALRPGMLGFCNQFNADWEHALRLRLNLPSHERPTLHRLDGNERLSAAELAEFKAFLRGRLGLKARGQDAAVGAGR